MGDPLCLLDATSLRAGEEDFVRYQYEGGTMVVPAVGPVYSPKHRWVYISDQEPTEAWLFKQYDARSSVAQRTFHNSFHDPYHAQRPKATHGRRSVEFRFLLTFPPVGSLGGAAGAASETSAKL